jgi:uncharacterized protein (DUF58 family)
MSSLNMPAGSESFVARMWRTRDRTGWRNFWIAMLALSAALMLALFSAAVAETGRTYVAGTAAVLALGLAGWVGVAIVPALARRTSLRWIAYHVDYRLPREGIIYLAAVFVLILAAVNTGNNLLFMVLACAIAGILISWALSYVVLTDVELKFDLPEHIFAEQPVLAEVELQNEKQMLPSFSLRVVGDPKSTAVKGSASNAPRRSDILSKPVFFPYIPRLSSSRQKVEVTFPHRGVYRQDSFGIRTRFPFGFFEKTRIVDSNLEIVVYPRVTEAEPFYDVLPLISGEMASQFRGRGHELHSLRAYTPTDSARFVDWKVTARTGHLMVREFAREDERRVLLVFDPYVGPAPTSSDQESAEQASAAYTESFERAVSMAACIAWHFNKLDSGLQFRTDKFSTPMAPASQIIYDALRELARIQPNTSSVGGTFLDALASEQDFFKIIITARPQSTIPSALWSSSYFLFIDRL